MYAIFGIAACSHAELTTGGNVKYVADMSRSQPSLGLSRDFEDGNWRLVDYETEAAVKGVIHGGL